MQAFERAHIDKLRPYLPECMVLLKRDGSFPLEGPCRIAAFGNGVRNTVKGGSGSGEVNSRYFVNVEQGLVESGFTITNGSWPDRFQERFVQAEQEFRRDLKRKAREQKLNYIAVSMGAVMKQPEYEIDLDFSADVAIYVVARLSGEGNDRLPEKGDFELTDSEVADILALDEAYERFMLVINAGGPVDLTPVMDVGNILVMSQLGVEAGAALADVLLGKAYPSGKLATTWAAYGDYCPIGDFAQWDDTRYREGIFVGYRYFDAAQVKPLFPFGFGLGYTDFALGAIECICEGTQVIAKAEITNVGEYRGKETLQIYASCPQGKLVREVKLLVGFVKTRELAPGESQAVCVAFDVRDIAGYDAGRASYILEPGSYVLLAGTSSANAEPCAVFEIEREVVVRQLRNLFGSAGFEDARITLDEGFAVEGLPRLFPAIDQIEPCSAVYEEDAGVPEMELLPDEALVYLNMGAFDLKGGVLSLIGDNSLSVAGAAGESTLQLKELGVESLVMADGPAGLRLARRFYEDGKGVHSVGSPIPGSVMGALPGPVRWLLERRSQPPKTAVIKEQYTTALPVATAIAQSFNLEFAEMCGDIVGAEMDVFGIDLWLAPALNVHRNVLCGRNFEYYSEDPFVSGKFAAAMTRGVQAHGGRGVTVKHFAANNQETNRYANNSIVSERALREIYLKGFEICVRESAPRAVMTSYNLINGVHTSESRDLALALRCEFGFAGVIMTDWIKGSAILTRGAKHPAPDPARVAAAGCSLFMPGSKGDLDALRAGLRRGTVTRRQLAHNAAWLVRTMWEMRALRE